MQPMSDENQIDIPLSFIALFVDPGRIKPREPRAFIAQRYELCEDLATMLVDHAETQLWTSGATHADVLDRMHRGLLDGDGGLAPPEAQWVARRLAELLGWDWQPQ